MFTAVVRVSGAGRLADFQERLRWLMVRDPEAEDYTEHHADGRLEYRFAPRKGIPFPAFAEASRAFPELRVEAEWERDGVRGLAVIEDGKVIEQATRGAPGDAAIDVTVEEDGRLALAMACRRVEGAWIGYAAAAERHTYFRYEAGRLTALDPETPDEALEQIAFGLVDGWIWYDEEEAALERARYANYGYTVRGANVRSEKLAELRRMGLRYSTLEPAAREVREALLTQWLAR